MEITFGSQIIQSYKRLSYTAWHALAEFVDNSTQSYIENRDILDSVLNDSPLRVDISYDNNEDYILIKDNSIGMDGADLKWALNVGKVPKNTSGRSRYGLGMKTAACWFGDNWSIKTKKLGTTVEHNLEIDVEKIASGELGITDNKVDGKSKDEHYTEIKIWNLNRGLRGRTSSKAKNYLRSMYRKDFDNLNLNLFFQGKLLKWDYNEMIYNKIHRNRAGEMTLRKFSFPIGEGDEKKTVKGWAGVFEKGSRKNAGFSIIQNNRIIIGWPDSYRPEILFGENRNDLVNQRLVGELFLDDFEVSHTKDEILFLNNESDELEAGLLQTIGDLKEFAQEYRKYLDDERTISEGESDKALNEFEQELKSYELKNKVEDNTVAEPSLIKNTNQRLIDAVMNRMPANLKAKVSKVEVLIYIDHNLSPNDPYVLIESTLSKDRVIIIINASHPHWLYLKGKNGILNFIRHCTYDGVAEWKAKFILGSLDPDTIKYIKDGLLRVPFEIESND